MAINNRTLEEELADKKIVGSYVLKPNRFYAKDGDHYISADVVSDGTASEIAESLREEGTSQIAQIRELGRSEIAELRTVEEKYSDAKVSLLQTYTRMYNYFSRQGLVALATIMATAIVNLNNM